MTLGDTYTSWNTYVFHPFIYPSANVMALIILESILFLYSIYLTIMIILTMRESCWKFFKDIWSYVDLLMTCLCWSSVVLFVAMVIMDTRTYDHLQNSEGNIYVDFRESGVTQFAWICVNAFLLTLTLILAVKQLRFVKFFAAFHLAFRVSFCVIFGCTLVYTLILVIYSLTAYLLFGSDLLQFHNVGAAFISLVAIFRGDSQAMVAMGENHLSFSIIFIMAYLSAIMFGVYSLIAAAFIWAYGVTRKQVNYHNAIKAHDHEVIPFLRKQLKRWIQNDKSKAAFRKVKFQDCSTLSSVTSSRSSLPDDELSAQGYEISAESDSLAELPENDSAVVRPVMNLAETVQINLRFSLGEELMTVSTSCEEVATNSSSAEEIATILGQEITLPNLAQLQQKDVTDDFGEFGADYDSSKCHPNVEDVLDDTEHSSMSAWYDPVKNEIPALTRVLEQLDKIGSIDDEVSWRIEAVTKKYLRRNINHHSYSYSHELVDEQTGMAKVMAGQEASPGRADVCSRVSPSPSRVVTNGGTLTASGDLKNQDMTTHDDVVRLRTKAFQEKWLAISGQETWV